MTSPLHRRLWGIAPIMVTNLADAGLVDARFNAALTKAAVQAFDDFLQITKSPSEQDNNVSSGSGNRRRRRRVQASGQHQQQQTPEEGQLTQNDSFFVHQRTRGYRLATPAISSCVEAQTLQEDLITSNAVMTYLESLDNAKAAARMVRSELLSIDMWAAVQRGPGAHHKDHVHEGVVVSGVYYAAVPPQSAPLLLKRPPEDIMPSSDDNDDDDDVVTIHPREGQLILFPPWVPHGVPPSSSDSRLEQPRVSFAFNLSGPFIGDAWDVTRV